MAKFEDDGSLTIDIAAFKKRFRSKKAKSWARPMIWMDAAEPSTIDRTRSEDIAIVNVLEQARHKFRFDPAFTRDERLAETRTAADYAYARGLSIIGFLMFILVMSDVHSRRLLILSGWKGVNVAHNDHIFHNSIKRQVYDEGAIKRVISGLRKPCPGRPFNRSTCDGFVSAKHGICWHCLQMYGQTRDLWPNWLLTLVRDDDKEYRLRAIEALYHREFHEETIGIAA